MAHTRFISDGGHEHYGDLRIIKTLYNVQAHITADLKDPRWETWMIKGPSDEGLYSRVRALFSFFSQIFKFYFQNETTIFDFDIYFLNPLQIISFPVVEGVPEVVHLTATPGHPVPFNGSPHTRAVYLATVELFDPTFLATASPQDIVEGLHTMHPHMVNFSFSFSFSNF